MPLSVLDLWGQAAEEQSDWEQEPHKEREQLASDLMPVRLRALGAVPPGRISSRAFGTGLQATEPQGAQGGVGVHLFSTMPRPAASAWRSLRASQGRPLCGAAALPTYLLFRALLPQGLQATALRSRLLRQGLRLSSATASPQRA